DHAFVGHVHGTAHRYHVFVGDVGRAARTMTGVETCDLPIVVHAERAALARYQRRAGIDRGIALAVEVALDEVSGLGSGNAIAYRSEERRVGEECGYSLATGYFPVVSYILRRAVAGTEYE